MLGVKEFSEVMAGLFREGARKCSREEQSRL